MENKFSDSVIINSFNHVIPFLPFIFEEDVSFALTDTEKYLLSVNGKELKFQVKVGDLIPNGGAVKEALATNNPVIKNVPKEIYGIPFRSYAIPLRENNMVVGAFVLGKSYARKEQLSAITQDVSAAIHETSDAIEDIVSQIKQIEETNLAILKSIMQADEKTTETNSIINLIDNISVQTYLLGVNASIDAAKAGIHGKSFEVVAQEIGRVSQTTKASISKISEILSYLSSSISKTATGLTESTSIFQQQMRDLDKIVGAMDELKETSRKLETLSESL